MIDIIIWGWAVLFSQSMIFIIPNNIFAMLGLDSNILLVSPRIRLKGDSGKIYRIYRHSNNRTGTSKFEKNLRSFASQ